ncbi:hypothetical protein FJ366_02540 [Candidatus Dependentiae bacterium]|nr:hypothetical protein [Candidatus Dependentiae bacterium]
MFFCGVFAPVSLQALLVEGVNPVSCTQGSFVYRYAVAEVSGLKTEKSISVSAEDLRFLKNNCMKPNFKALLVAKKVSFFTEMVNAFLAKKATSFRLKTDQSSDSIAIEFLVDVQKKVSVVVYSSDEKCPFWVVKLLENAFLSVQPSKFKKILFYGLLGGGAGFLLRFPSLMRASMYKKGSRMAGFSDLLATYLANSMHLKDDQVFVHSVLTSQSTGFKVGRLYDASVPAMNLNVKIPQNAQLVVIDAPNTLTLARLSAKGVFAQQSDAILKVVTLPLSACSVFGVGMVKNQLKKNGWVLAVIDDQKVEYKITTMEQVSRETVIDPSILFTLSGLISFGVDYCLLLNPADGLDFNILKGEQGRIFVIPNGGMLSDSKNSCARLLAQQLLTFVSPENKKKFLASDFIVQFDDCRQSDELLLLDDVAAIDALLDKPSAVVAEEVVSSDSLQDRTLDKATFKYNHGNVNPLFSYDLVVASCLNMQSLEEIQAFINRLVMLPACDEDMDCAHEAYSTEIDFSETIFTPGTVRAPKTECKGRADCLGVVVDSEIGGFAESELKTTQDRRCYKVEVPFQQRIVLLPFSLVATQSSFVHNINQLEEAGWKVVIINDSQSFIAQPQADAFVGVRQNVFVVMSPFGADNVQFCVKERESKVLQGSWIDAVRLWIQDPIAINTLYLPEGPVLKWADGTLKFTPYVTYGSRRTQDDKLKSMKQAGLSFGRIDELSINEVENPCRDLPINQGCFTSFVEGFKASFNAHQTKLYNGLNEYDGKDSYRDTTYEYAERVVNYDQFKNVIIQTINSADEIDLIVRNIGREENMQCPDMQARYLIVPLRLLANNWLDMVCFGATSKLELRPDGPLNVAGWRLVVVFDSVYGNLATFSKNIINPLVQQGGTISSCCTSYSIVAPAQGYYLGLAVNSFESNILEERAGLDRNGLIQKIKNQQLMQKKYKWSVISKSLA